MKKALIGFMLCLSVTATYAQKEIVMMGTGTMTCKKYMEWTQSMSGSEKEIVTSMFEDWIKGYLTGRNRQLDTLGYKMVDIGNVAQLGSMLTFACANAIKKDAGTMPIFVIVDKIYEDSFDTKVLKK